MNYLDRTFLPRIDLAREADFTVGALRVRPSRREIEAEGVCQVLQPRVMQVLVALAHPSAEVVSQDELISRCWGGLAVGEDAVGRCIGQLRRLAEQWPAPPFEIITIASVGYRLEPAARPAADLAGPLGRRRGPTAPVVVAFAAALAILAGFTVWFGRDVLSRGAPATVLVAIPPIRAPAGDQALRAFADSLGDQVIGVMNANQVPTLPRADSQALGGPGAERSAQQLGVTLLLDASVQREAGTLRARARLDDVRQRVTLWSTSLDGPSSGSDGLGRQMAATVTNVLLCANDFQRSPSAPKAPEVVALFFHACDLSTNMIESLEGRERLIAALREVIRRAPRFAHAHAWLANVQADRYRFMPSDQGQERHAEAMSEANRALELDPREGEAYLALSLLAPVTDFRGREQLLLKGMSGSPSNANLPWRYAALLGEVGRIREANTFAQRAAAQAPLDPALAAYGAYFEGAAGDFTQARADIAKVQQSWPHVAVVVGIRFLIEEWAGDQASAKALLDEDSVGNRFSRACVAARAARTPSSVAVAEREAKAFGASGPFAIGRAIECLSAIGSLDAAFDLAARWDPLAYGGDGPGIFFFPPTAAMRRDPRFMPLAARLGLVDYWRATGKWPDFCAEPGLPYSCVREADRLALLKKAGGVEPQ